jgi:hypothetical protein
MMWRRLHLTANFNAFHCLDLFAQAQPGEPGA